VFLILIYSPILIALPILLLIGVFFIVVRGGFVVVLAVAFCLLVGLAWLARLALRARRQRRGVTAGLRARTEIGRAASRGHVLRATAQHTDAA
jgi:hypothetical protein